MHLAAFTNVTKARFVEKMTKLVDSYPCIVVVNVDNVTSRQMQNVRLALRGHAEVLMGKNTLMRMVVRKLEPTHKYLRHLLPLMKTNVGFIFNMGDVHHVCDIIDKCRMSAIARVGAIAPCDVVIRKQQTALVPTETSFFQAVNVPTKITKGAIEIVNDVGVIAKGEKVTQSQAALLAKLNMKPFEYGLVPVAVYDTESLEIVVAVAPRSVSSSAKVATVANQSGDGAKSPRSCECHSDPEDDYFDLFGDGAVEDAVKPMTKTGVSENQDSDDSEIGLDFDIFA
eukprot:TRINITY_DN2967_c0_g2_i1.p1 TRINITY_DN2967_c0_g2~~TRINITY_DN2967_c0_g2_i1.p1  ORF type:complete len:284 (+),score=68.47 TRINITY_DN2967_c0_g2_i1:60-911(+)